MKRQIKKFLALVITACVGLSLLTGTVSAQTIESASSNDQLKQLDKITGNYGMTIKKSETRAYQEYAAKYDSIQEFEAALQAGEIGVAFTKPDHQPAKSTLLSGDATHIMPRAGASMTVLLVDGGIYDINASMGYTYSMISGFKYYTGFTSFAPYFVGLHPGVTFSLLSWYGTPMSDYWYTSSGQLIYVPASTATMYYYQWEGNVDTTISIGGISYVVSQYAWSYGFG